ncbi:MAG: hypothetical protein ACOYXA_02775 [Bacteroidota bacterium]
MSTREQRNRNIGLITSLGIHAALLLLFLFIMAWRAPNPPLPEFGIELNFGVDNQGSGDIQPETPPASEQTDEQTEEVEAAPEVTEQQAPQQETIVSEQENIVAVKEEKPKEEVVKPKETEKPKEEVKKEEPKKSEETNTSAATETKAKTESTQSQGDDKNKTGDKGNPEGSLDAKALYGKQGGGGGGDGLSLQMSGWAWADTPRIPSLPDNEDGRIEFVIECDSEGEIIGITTKERGLSPRAEQLLKEEIRKNSLIRTSGGQTPERSKGRVVFVLKTK